MLEFQNKYSTKAVFSFWNWGRSLKKVDSLEKKVRNLCE